MEAVHPSIARTTLAAVANRDASRCHIRHAREGLIEAMKALDGYEPDAHTALTVAVAALDDSLEELGEGRLA